MDIHIVYCVVYNVYVILRCGLQVKYYCRPTSTTDYLQYTVSNMLWMYPVVTICVLCCMSAVRLCCSLCNMDTSVHYTWGEEDTSVKQCCCPRGKSSRILEDQFTSPSPCPQALSPWQHHYREWVPYRPACSRCWHWSCTRWINKLCGRRRVRRTWYAPARVQ